VAGMPIGAQLPIKQAERIEIIFGPAAAVYGADASAGVINIILKETDRPSYTQADLSVGTQVFSSLDMMFGGKVGTDKNVLNFSFYGNNTTFNHRPIYYDTSFLYNPTTYETSDISRGSFATNPNYVGTSNRPLLESLPHLSRLIGGSLKYRMYRLSAQAMYRRDHSALGANPLSVSYSNPLNYLGETIVSIDFGLDKDYKKGGFDTRVYFQRYLMDSRSSFNYVENSLGRVADFMSFVTNPSLPGDTTSAYIEQREKIFEEYFYGTRFSFAKWNEFGIEQLVNYNPIPNLELTGGFNLRVGGGTPQFNFLERPYVDSLFFRTPGLGPFLISTNTEFNSFVQAFYTRKRFNVIAGLQIIFNPLFGRSSNPRLAVLYKLKENMSIRASAGRAFRTPSPFYEVNSFRVDAQSGIVSLSRINDFNLKAENTVSYELGLRWRKSKKMEMDVALFYSKTDNIILFNNASGFDIDTTTFSVNSGFYELGFFNVQSSNIPLLGVQAQLHFKDMAFRYPYNLTLGLNYNQLGDGSSYGFPPYRVFDVIGRFKLTKQVQFYLKVNNIFNKGYHGIDATGTNDDLHYNPQQLRHIRFGLTYKTN